MIPGNYSPFLSSCWKIMVYPGQIVAFSGKYLYSNYNVSGNYFLNIAF